MVVGGGGEGHHRQSCDCSHLCHQAGVSWRNSSCPHTNQRVEQVAVSGLLSQESCRPGLLSAGDLAVKEPVSSMTKEGQDRLPSMPQ